MVFTAVKRDLYREINFSENVQKRYHWR